jgi:8-oxo-dGTP pyrophosphatase MutT (NUDIX family)
MASQVTEIEFGFVPGKKNAAFVCVHAKSKIYEFYDHVPVETRNQVFDVCLMMHRWDGMVGFPGGMVDKLPSGDWESLSEAALREAVEEVNLHLVARKLKPLSSHALGDGWLNVHAFSYDLGYQSVKELNLLLKRCVDAEHTTAEGSPFWQHIADYGNGKGIAKTLDSNNLASAVKEELIMLMDRIGFVLPSK